jgi:hypothetical protein
MGVGGVERQADRDPTPRSIRWQRQASAEYNVCRDTRTQPEPGTRGFNGRSGSLGGR